MIRDDSMRMCFMLDTVFAGNAIKGQIAFYQIRDAYLKGYVKRVIALGYKDSIVNSKIIKRAIPFNDKINKIIGVFGRKFLLQVLSRDISEKIFDIGASTKIPECDLFYFQPPIWPRSLGKAKNNGSVISVRDSTANLYHVLKLASREYGDFDRNIQRIRKQAKIRQRFFEKTDCILACSEYSKRTHMDYGIPEEKVIVSGQGVDTKRFTPSRNQYDSDFRGIFVGGSTSPLKGLRYLLEAWDGFAKQNQELMICGSIDSSLESLFTKYKKMMNINAMGFVDPAEQYKKASILIYPSLTEGFEKVTMEAMSSGLPIITTTNTGASSLIKEGKEGFVVPIRDSAAIEKHVRYFYENPGEIKRMGRNARRLAERYDWNSFSKRMCSLFELVYEKWGRE